MLPILSASGGQIAQANGSQYVAAFGHELGGDPARIALLAAHRLIAAQITPRILVDVAQVAVLPRPDGSHRIFSPLFRKKDRFPTPSDPTGVILSSAAVDVLSGLQCDPLAQRPDWFVLSAADADSAKLDG
jgi:hypothetical protein